MAIEKINIEQFLELAKKHPVLDVRSPGEYKHAHMPGAHSLPLFTDEERKVVGTTYKQQSREKAIKVGLDFFGPKMRNMVEEVESIGSRLPIAIGTAVGSQEVPGNNNNPTHDSRLTTPDSRLILLYCWRGGMRSAGVAWLLDLYGFKVYTLVGGYKSFRRYALNTFSLPFQFRILGGYTGSGKTELLQALAQKGEPVIDLESIANHKGSAFGNIGMPAQPGQEMFENLIAMQLRNVCYESNETSKASFRGFGGIWLEDESQRIGQVNIPGELWAKMRSSPLTFLNIPFEERLQHINREYGTLDKQKLIDAIGRIWEKLGGLNGKNAISFLLAGNTLESFRILLGYYDKLYFKALHNRKSVNSLLHTVECKSVTPENACQLIINARYQPEKA